MPHPRLVRVGLGFGRLTVCRSRLFVIPRPDGVGRAEESLPDPAKAGPSASALAALRGGATACVDASEFV